MLVTSVALSQLAVNYKYRKCPLTSITLFTVKQVYKMFMSQKLLSRYPQCSASKTSTKSKVNFFTLKVAKH